MPDVYFSSGSILVFVNEEEVVQASAVYMTRFAYQTGDTDTVVAIAYDAYDCQDRRSGRDVCHISVIPGGMTQLFVVASYSVKR